MSPAPSGQRAISVQVMLGGALAQRAMLTAEGMWPKGKVVAQGCGVNWTSPQFLGDLVHLRNCLLTCHAGHSAKKPRK